MIKLMSGCLGSKRQSKQTEVIFKSMVGENVYKPSILVFENKITDYISGKIDE